MMEIVTKTAKENGYEPDAWFSPDAVNSKGRPYPYMIFENMKKLEIDSVKKVVKVGDTISDILEGKNAGDAALDCLREAQKWECPRKSMKHFQQKKKKLP